MEQEKFENFWKDKVDYLLIQRFTNPFMENPIYDKEGKLIHDKVEEEYRFEDSEPLGECYQPFQRLYITNNGDVHPCCSAYGLRITLGNIYRDSITNIWKNSRSQGLRNTVNAESSKQPNACRLCREASAAKHNVVEQSVQLQQSSDELQTPV
jgi:radical SAM protein with 4Fe4S-binding SPASM domain